MCKNIIITLCFLCLLPVSAFAESAIGQTANYATSWPIIEYESESAIIVGVHDQRPYVKNNGWKSPTYAGTVRALYGNPWNVNTQSGKPLSDDIASAVVSGFKRVGTQAEAISLSYSDDQQAALGKLKEASGERLLLITLKEWRSDSYTNQGFFIDAILKVYDKAGNELASSSTSTAGDGSVESTYEAARSHLSLLLNDPKVKIALQ